MFHYYHPWDSNHHALPCKFRGWVKITGKKLGIFLRMHERVIWLSLDTPEFSNTEVENVNKKWFSSAAAQTV